MSDPQGSAPDYAGEKEPIYADPYTRIAWWEKRYEKLEADRDSLLARQRELLDFADKAAKALTEANERRFKAIRERDAAVAAREAAKKALEKCALDLGAAEEREAHLRAALGEVQVCTGHYGGGLSEPVLCRRCQDVILAALAVAAPSDTGEDT